MAKYIVDEGGCWIWQGKLLNGYGIGVGGHRAHRIYYERHVGPIPEGYDVHHECKVPACVNPAHLRAIDPREHDLEHFLYERGRDLEFIERVREEGRRPGASSREVAVRYDMDHRTVLRWWKGEAWGDITLEPVVTPPNICALDGCDNPCVGHRHKKYCSIRCRHTAGERRRRAGIYSPDGSSGRYFEAA